MPELCTCSLGWDCKQEIDCYECDMLHREKLDAEIQKEGEQNERVL